MRRSPFLLALVCCAVAALVGFPTAQSQSPTLVLEHVNIVDVRAGRLVSDQTVVIEQDRITRVGPANSARLPLGATVLNARTKYLIPGLWDMHVHAAWNGIDKVFAPLFVANGVTGVREMYGDPAVIRAWKSKYGLGEPWPRMIAAGHILDGPNPIWPGSTVARSPDEARQAVDSLRASGADFIKVYTRLPRDAYIAAIDEAKRVGTYVVGHVPDAVSIGEASDLGQRSIEHLTGVTIECSKDADALRAERAAVASEASALVLSVYARQTQRILATQDSARCSALIARLARNHTWQVPTLVQLRGFASLDDERFIADPRVRYMPQEVVKSWDWRKDFRFRERTPEDWSNARRHYRRYVEILGAAHRAGIPILVGTDVLNPFTFPGFSLHDELTLLVEAGLTPAEALRAATLNPATFLNTQDSLGTVEKGKFADLVVLDANPLEDVRNTARINAVILNGRLYNRTQLDKLLVTAERTANPRPSAPIP
ncbi:MAG TPA: amidohydrolase family protein [Pyrinomonadaceae bacterium]|nr:amidohydrolase family protein [Pyrinomonadaceae bacterium]